jgi:hypothetical protein
MAVSSRGGVDKSLDRGISYDNGPRAASRRGYRSGPTELSSLLAHFVERDGRTLNGVAQAASVDVGYLWHLRAGSKQRPSRDVLIRLGLALKLEPEELDELLVAADYAPITARRT